MGNKAPSILQDEEIDHINRETGFSHSEIEKLFSRFAHLDRTGSGFLTKNDLIQIPELAVNPLCDRLIQMFFLDCSRGDERIGFRQFMKVLATFKVPNGTRVADGDDTDGGQPNVSSRLTLSNSTIDSTNFKGKNVNIDTKTNISVSELDDNLRNKLFFVFRVYDADEDGQISFEDLRSILKMMVGSYIEEVQLNRIATRAFSEVDEDNDGIIEFNEFCKLLSGKDLDHKLRVRLFK